MTSIAELFALFPGYQSNKKIILINLSSNTIKITYSDGRTRIIVDPVQVQDIEVPDGRGAEFMRMVRSIEPTASKAMYLDRSVLMQVLKRL